MPCEGAETRGEWCCRGACSIAACTRRGKSWPSRVTSVLPSPGGLSCYRSAQRLSFPQPLAKATQGLALRSILLWARIWQSCSCAAHANPPLVSWTLVWLMNEVRCVVHFFPLSTQNRCHSTSAATATTSKQSVATHPYARCHCVQRSCFPQCFAVDARLTVMSCALTRHITSLLTCQHQVDWLVARLPLWQHPGSFGGSLGGSLTSVWTTRLHPSLISLSLSPQLPLVYRLVSA
jgi:hypothetical protein